MEVAFHIFYETKESASHCQDLTAASLLIKLIASRPQSRAKIWSYHPRCFRVGRGSTRDERSSGRWIRTLPNEKVSLLSIALTNYLS